MPILLTQFEWFDSKTWEANNLASQLLPAVIKAAWKLVNQNDAIGELDDLISVGGLALVKALPRIMRGEIDDLPAYVYRVARNAQIRYLRRCPLTDSDVELTTNRLTELELVSRHDDCWQTIVAACQDDTDRSIIVMRNDGHTMTTVARLLGVNKSTITKRLRRIRESLQNSGNF